MTGDQLRSLRPGDPWQPPQRVPLKRKSLKVVFKRRDLTVTVRKKEGPDGQKR